MKATELLKFKHLNSSNDSDDTLDETNTHLFKNCILNGDEIPLKQQKSNKFLLIKKKLFKREDHQLNTSICWNFFL